MQDLTERLDAELGRSPEPRFEVATAVAAGRRAVRRRRLAAATAAAAVAAVLGSVAWTTAPGGDGRPQGGDVAVEPTPTPTPAPPPPTAPDGTAWGPEDVLQYDDDGTPVLNPEAEVIERRPFGAGGEIFHVALGGHEYYAFTMADGSASTQRLPAQGLRLQEWARAQLSLDDPDAGGGTGVGTGTEADRSWVVFESGSRLAAGDGVRIVDQRPDPGFGPRFAAPGEPTAAAEVVRDGATYYLAVRRADDGATEAIPYRRDSTITSLDAFLSYAREQYATNDAGGSEGLR